MEILTTEISVVPKEPEKIKHRPNSRAMSPSINDDMVTQDNLCGLLGISCVNQSFKEYYNIILK